MPGIRESIELACSLETLARKPGNVHPDREFEDLTVADLLLAGLAVANILERANSPGVGQSILDSVRAGRAVTRSNANLGIVLLLAPLCAADTPNGPTRESIAGIVHSLTVDDTRQAYQAIREAQPGGLGHVENQDVSQEPTVNLLEAMRIAANHDTIALVYTHGFVEIFELGVEALVVATAAECGLEESVVWCHLHWMAIHPDSLIARKRGGEIAQESSRQARKVIDLSLARPLDGRIGIPTPGFLARPELADLDDWLRADGHRRNPGTSADLVAASLYVAIRTGHIDPGRTPWRKP